VLIGAGCGRETIAGEAVDVRGSATVVTRTGADTRAVDDLGGGAGAGMILRCLEARWCRLCALRRLAEPREWLPRRRETRW
jgi:hypothetical protein